MNSNPNPKRISKTAITGVLLLLAILLVIGIFPRLKRRSELSALANEQAQSLPIVNVQKPREGEATNELVLPATTQAVQDAIISARSTGYVKRWVAGLGQNVKAGELLAEIVAPESDQALREASQQVLEAGSVVNQGQAELAQAQASVEQAQAALKQSQTNFELARVNLERSKTLVADGIVAHQDTDDKQAIFDARKADVEAAQALIRARQSTVKAQQSVIQSRQSNVGGKQANMQRLKTLKSFEQIRAPFAGVVTARTIEVGALVNAGGGTTANPGLYRISKIDTIRTWVNVPQTYIAAMKLGVPATVHVKEMPDEKFSGKIASTSNAIDPATRTLLVEVRVPNPGHKLMPGMSVQVKFSLPSTSHALLIPVSALVVNAKGTQVLVVGENHKVHEVKVEVGRDLGKDIEILAGLTSDSPVILNPSDALHEGTDVQIARPRQ